MYRRRYGLKPLNKQIKYTWLGCLFIFLCLSFRINGQLQGDEQRNATDNQHKKVYHAGKFQTETKNCTQSCLVLNTIVERKYPLSTNILFFFQMKKK